MYKTPPAELKGERVRLVPTVAPPVKLVAVAVVAPRPVTVESVSASEVSPEEDDEIVIVPADSETVVDPEPFNVIVPLVSLILVTIDAESRLTTGFWPLVTAIPVPPVTP